MKGITVNSPICIMFIIVLLFSLTLSCAHVEERIDVSTLSHAAMYGDITKTYEFIAKDPNVNIKDEYGITPLHWAALNDHTQIAEILINQGADINLQTLIPLKLGAFLKASGKRWVILLSGRDFTVQFLGTNISHITPLHLSSINRQPVTAKVLLTHGANIDVKDSQGWTPLFYSLINSSTEVLRILIDHGANVNGKDNDGNTPLHSAVLNFDTEITDILLNHGSDPNAKDNDGKTPLHVWATHAEEEGPQILRLLLTHGADVNARDKTGRTPLFYSDDMEVAEVLLANGADVNAKDNEGKTLLHLLAEEGVYEGIELLLVHGVDVNVQDNFNHTPMYYSSQKGHRETTDILEKNGGLLK